MKLWFLKTKAALIKKSKKLIIVIFIAAISHSAIIAGEQDSIRSQIINSNNIKLIAFNYGSLGGPSSWENNFVWKNIANMGEFGPMIAAEVVDESGNSIHIVSDSFVRQNQGDYSPEGTQKWGWLPSVNSMSSDSPDIANYLDSESWPNGWQNWISPNLSNIHPLQNEVFYKMDDFTNAEFNYIPSISNPTMLGLGISAEVYISQFGNELSNAIIITYKIKNESEKNLQKLYWGFMGDPTIGGPSDYADDYSCVLNNDSGNILPEAHNTIYVYDADGIGQGGSTTGVLGFKFLQTPSDLGLTSAHSLAYTYSAPNVPLNDPFMYELFTSGIEYDGLYCQNSGDLVVHFGTGPFALNAGETTEVILAVFFASDITDLEYSAKYLTTDGLLTSANDNNIEDMSFSLSQNYPNPFNPSTTINFSISKSGFVQLDVYNLLGQRVASLVNEEKQIGNYVIKYDASSLPSGVYFYRLQSGEFVVTKKFILLR
jgi:hypothetical protein